MPESISKKLSDAGWDGESDAAEFVATMRVPEAGTVTMNADEVKTLREQAAAGAEASIRFKERDAQDLVEGALRLGKIGRGERDFWVKRAIADPEEVKTYFDSLEKGRIVELGEHGSGEGGEEPDQSVDGIEKEINKRVAVKMKDAKDKGLEMSDSDAYAEVLEEDPDLYERLQAASVATVES